MKIKLFAVSILLGLCVAQLQASPGYAYPPQGMVPQQQEPGPGEVLQEGMSKLLAFMRQQERPGPELTAKFLDTEIAPYFDFAYMAQWTAGPAYRNMSDQQRSVLEHEIKRMLLSALSQHLGRYDNQDVQFFQPRRVGQNEVKVRIGILQASGYPAKIDFRFYRSEAGWKVFDVSANGASALSFYRQYFARQASLTGSVYQR